jgi:hypothetical protein
VRIVVAVGAVLLILFAVTVARRSSHTYPVSDEAIIELATLNAASGRQLLGPYSRYVWHHPGPALFYALAPFYRGSGDRSTGLAAGALLINVAVLAIALAVLVRTRQPALAVAVALVGAFYVGRLGPLLVSAWNAHVALLAAAALILTSAAVAAGSFGALPLVALMASFALQTHIATFPIVAVSVGVVVVQAVRAGASARRPWPLAGAVLVVLWAAPIFEQVASRGGNLAKLWQFFSSPAGSAAPAIAFEAWADMLTFPLRAGLAMPRGLLIPHDGAGWRGVGAIAGLMAIACVALWAFRHSRPFHFWLAVEVFGIGALGLLAVSRIPDGIHDHEVFWVSAVGWLMAAAALSVPMTRVHESWSRPVAVATSLLFIAGVSVIGARELMRVAERSRVMERNDRRTEQATRAVESALEQTGSRRVKVLMDQPVWETAAGVVLQLRKKGVPVAVQPGLENMFPGTAAADGTEDLEVTFCGGPCHERLTSRPGNMVLLYGDGLAIDAIALK